jgi:ABC-type transport system involved in multi-copper enzyme maturation permease subunit
MTRLRTLTGMAIHEMWISFQLIAVVGLPLLGGLLAIAVPPDLAGVTAVGGAGFWYAVGASVAIVVAAGLAAGTIAHERRRGTVAWMAVRAVPRSAILLSWFAAFGLLLAAGIALGSIGAWLAALGRAEAAPDVVPFASAVVATLGAGLACVAAGLLIGTFLPTIPSTAVAVAVGAALVAVSIGTGPGGLPSPTGGIGLLAHLDGASHPLGDALRSAGAALAATAILLVLASVGLDRSDL